MLLDNSAMNECSGQVLYYNNLQKNEAIQLNTIHKGSFAAAKQDSKQDLH